MVQWEFMGSHPENQTKEKEGGAEKQNGAIGRIQRWLRAGILGSALLASGGEHPPYTPTTTVTIGAEEPLPGTYVEEQQNIPSLTEEQYLALLARTITTPEKLDRFIKTRMRYAWDSPDPDDHLREGTAQNHGGYVQTPQETLRRTDKGKMLGDCEDYAIFVQEILRRQGKNAHVVLLLEEKHAMCIWVEKDDEGRYRGRGTDETGVTCATGRATLAEAIRSAALQYPFHPYCIPVGRHVGSFWYTDMVSIHAFDPDLPGIARISGLELASLVALLGGAYGTYRFFRRRREEKETWKGYFTTFRLH